MTNRLPWSKGYFKFLTNLPLRAEDVLKQHCFFDFHSKYYDEFTNELPGRVEPCGDWGLDSYRTIDDVVSDAVGIPAVTD